MFKIQEYLVPSQIEALTSDNPQAEIDQAPPGSKMSYRVLGIVDDNDQLSENGLQLIEELRSGNE